jgi:hypothetical protein
MRADDEIELLVREGKGIGPADVLDDPAVAAEALAGERIGIGHRPGQAPHPVIRQPPRLVGKHVQHVIRAREGLCPPTHVENEAVADGAFNPFPVFL